MAKIFKRTFFGITCLLACLFAGAFFVGCGIDYSKITLLPTHEEVYLSAGETQEVIIDIEGYQKGFSNIVKVSSDKTAIAEVKNGDISYPQNDQIKIKITAKAGGQATITVTAYDGKISCDIKVFVDQASGTMVSNNRLMYLSESTPFVPTADYFEFDSHTTLKELDYYYLNVTNMDFSNKQLLKVDKAQGKATFTNTADDVGVVGFDSATLKSDSKVYLDESATSIRDAEDGSFKILTVYSPSVGTDNLLYSINTVYILPAIEVSYSGGYLNGGKVDEFKPIDGNITIVPNNIEKAEYILKVEVNSKSAEDLLSFEISQDNKSVLIDFCEEPVVDPPATEPPESIVKYFKISQNSQVQAKTEFSLNVFYNIAQDVEGDESVNQHLEFVFDTKIAPSDITINGSTDSESLTLYNYYKFPDYGWNELDVKVVSSNGSMPTYQGVYFKFDSKYIDLMHNNKTVTAVDEAVTIDSSNIDRYIANIFTAEDLQESFYVRGKYGASQTSNTNITVCLVSDVLPNDGRAVNALCACSVVAGATALSKEVGYGLDDYYYLDRQAGSQVFDSQIYANQAFQYFTYRFVGGTDVLDISAGSEVCRRVESPASSGVYKYYLGMELAPKKVGVGIYRINLDNGMPIDLTFNVVQTLSTSSTRFSIVQEGYTAKTHFEISRSEESDYDDNLRLEILNNSNKDQISFRSVANLKIDANISQDALFDEKDASEPPIVSFSSVDSVYKIVTNANGKKRYNLKLVGYSVDAKFSRVNKSITYNLEVISYSLVNEFYIKNGDNYALNNLVYYGEMLSSEDAARKIDFSAEANSKNSFGFYIYDFNLENLDLPNLFAIADADPKLNGYYSYSMEDDQVELKYSAQVYSQDVVYFVADKSTYLMMKLTRTDAGGDSKSLAIRLTMPKKLMFNPISHTYIEKDEDGNIIAEYLMEFTDVPSGIYPIYDIGANAKFDIRDFTFSGPDNTTNVSLNWKLQAYIAQRDSTPRYEVRINREKYASVEAISLANSKTTVDFSSKNGEYTYTVGVYTYPSNSTKKEIKAEFIKSAGNPYIDMVKCEIKEMSKDLGAYLVTLSCEEFFRDNPGVVNYEVDLSGKVYIYPKEWGDTYSDISANLAPVCLQVHFRNGTRANPYLLEDAQDVIDINSNETTLKSHYEIRKTIDMSSVENFVPIGILNNEVKGFSGSIVGTSSYSAITNIVISNNNFYKVVSGFGYGGLFAKINNEEIEKIYGVDVRGHHILQTAIENVTVSGKIELTTNKQSYVGLLSAWNEGVLVNVGAQLDKSTIQNTAKLYFGGLVGINYGYINQDFLRYTEANGSVEFEIAAGNKINVFQDEERDLVFYSSIDGGCKGKISKNLAYFNDYVEIKTTNAEVYAGGITGASLGVITRTTDENLKKYGYSAYSAYSLLKISGEIKDAQKVVLGGAVGVLSYFAVNGYYPANIYTFAGIGVDGYNSIENLLLGGVVDSSNLAINGSAYDVVGGLVGLTDGLNEKSVYVLKNTSRTFVRGFEYVGGLVGYDFYTAGADDNKITNFGADNLLQAIDDGRNIFESAMVIKFKEVSDSDQQTKLAGMSSADKPAFYSIGNWLANARDYGSAFSEERVVSYVGRSPKAIGGGLSIDPSLASTGQTYGDFLIYDKGLSKIVKAYSFKKENVKLEYEGVSPYKMAPTDPSAPDMFFVNYFEAKSYLNGETDLDIQSEIDILNYIDSSADNFPFQIKGGDVSITTSTSAFLKIDLNGGLSLKGGGIAQIRLSSLLNINEEKSIYLFITNYFDKDVESSIFYTSASASGANIVSGTLIGVYGKQSTAINLLPSYNYSAIIDHEEGEKEVKINQNGILNFGNVAYWLAKNNDLTADVDPELAEKPADYFSTVQVNKQTIVFYKSLTTAVGGEQDEYTLTPVLKIEAGGNEYYYLLDGSKIEVVAEYKQVATSITLTDDELVLRTDEYYEDEIIQIVSENQEEKLFYKIFDKYGNLIQSRIPDFLSEVESYGSDGEYDITSGDLFDFSFKRVGTTNKFVYSLRVNKDSEKFKNRLVEDIYGEYRFEFFANELEEGVTNYFMLTLLEAEINSVSITNYSNINDYSSQGDILVTSQRGLFEIVIDPLEAMIDQISILNSDIQNSAGRDLVEFTFVYEKITEAGVEFVEYNIGSYLNGKYTFSFQKMLDDFALLNKKWEDEGKNWSVSYTGKVYFSYLMGSANTENGDAVGIDVEVEDFRGRIYSTHKDLTAELGNYARLSFVDKQNLGNNYYLARGLSYQLTLDYYGFTKKQIEVEVSDPSVASVVENADGTYTISVVQTPIIYNPGEEGRLVYLDTKVKLNDGSYERTQRLSIRIMEYVLNYHYVEGVYQDLVDGMQDGEISLAIGTPYQFKLDFERLIEYDRRNAEVVQDVSVFMEDFAKEIDWKVYYDQTTVDLSADKAAFSTAYYRINGLTFTPMRLHSAESKIYYFSVGGEYKMANGRYRAATVADLEKYPIYTEFVFDVHEQSTQDTPLPIESYEDLLKMADGEWYILLKDITLPADFKPLKAKVDGFDGNSYSINLGGTYDFGDASDIGLFEQIKDDAVIKNVVMQLYSDTVFKTTSTNFNVGLIAAENNGIITNCLVDSTAFGNPFKLSVASVVGATGSYVAGLVGNNSGFITNSRSQLRMIASVNLGGLVGVNSGHIASCIFLNGNLKNQANSSSGNHTAGLVVDNTGNIYTSYSSGAADANKTFYRTDNLERGNAIQSNNNIAGFVYTNNGYVQDCYSNLQLQSGAASAGFAFENGGTIKNAFSTSVLESRKSSSYGFASVNSTTNSTGTVENCYYLSDNMMNAGDPIDNLDDDVNVSIGDNPSIKILPLKLADFANLEKYFSDFVVVEGRNINSVWFFNDDSNDLNGFKGQQFNTSRLELVAPNIWASSRRLFDYAEDVTDEESGASYVKYHYIYAENYPVLGSQYNPITIATAEEMERYILQENNSSNYNYSHYRLVGDVDYQGYFYNSEIYVTRFRGYFEGNFMSISSLPLLSSKSLQSAGLFAEIEKSTAYTNSVGAVMNFDYSPITVSFSNANVVGSVTGKLMNATLVNVNVLRPSSDGLLVVGKNIAGGVVGLTSGNFKIQNVNGELGAKARHQRLANIVETQNNYNQGNVDYSIYSFAGSLVGVLGGKGKLFNSQIDGEISVLADKVGLAFGFVDQNAVVEKLSIDIGNDMLINAYSYGGFVAGESKGSLKDVSVNGDVVKFENFKQVPFVPMSVGGIAGLLSGGTLENITMTQDISISSASASSGVSNLGGIAGEILQQTKMKNIKVEGEFVGFGHVGGVAGTVRALLDITDIKLSNCQLSVVGHRIDEIAIGGIAGQTINDGVVKLSNSYAYPDEIKGKMDEISSKKAEIVNKKSELVVAQNAETAAKANYVAETDTEEKRVLERIWKEKQNTRESLEIELNRLANEVQRCSDQIIEMKNIIDVEINVNVFIYGNDNNCYVGSFVGANTNSAENSIADAICSIVGSISVIDKTVQGNLANVNYISKTNDFDMVKPDADQIGQIKTFANEEEGYRTSVYCNITYSAMAVDDDDTHNYSVSFSIYGEGRGAAEISFA